MLTCCNRLGIYVSCDGKCLAIYRSILLHNYPIRISSHYFPYSALNYRREKFSPLRKKNIFFILLRNIRFRWVWISRFLRTTTCWAFRSDSCGYDSVSYATYRSVIAMDNKKSPARVLHIFLYVRCITRCYACHFKRKY